MDIEKLIERLRQHEVACVRAYGRYCSICDEIVTALSTLQAENKKLRAENIRWGQVASEQDKQLDKLQTALEQVKQCIEIVETQRDAAIKELENYMVQDALDGNKPCEICSKVSDTSCEYCNPKWREPV